MKTSKSRSCSSIAVFTGILLVIALVGGCASAQSQLPTRDQLLGRIMSADNFSVELVRGEIAQVTGDIGILTTSTGYLTPLARSQLAGSIAGRFETLANIGISIKPLNERESGFDSVDAKEVLAARLTTDVCLACSQGPIASVQNIAERVAREGTLAAQDSSYLENLSIKLKKASDLIGRCIIETDPSVRSTIAQQVTELCTQLEGQER